MPNFQNFFGVRPSSKFSTREIRKLTRDTTKHTRKDMKIQRGELMNVLIWLKNIYTWFNVKHINGWVTLKCQKNLKKNCISYQIKSRFRIESNVSTIRWIIQLQIKFTQKSHNTSLWTEYLIWCTKLKSHCHQDSHTHYHTL